ncbi:hypothetical protein Dsin_024394 [Dipteronia sinensis]|uniref:Reverse transcriptase zinc-binding domain-containing protein n=1 Tax=Dipteronia sinensis TaxID=43782 RepID=A0AAE0DXC8_9ROSI|nr:hypothetical protein Dsin_024394 [Dipteronia sinensis]
MAGSRWRIGTRSSVSIYKDRWIPRSFSFAVQSPPVLGENSLVSSLFTALGSWNDQLIWSSFSSEETKAILSLPRGSSRVDDSLLWHYDKSGRYSMRRGYKHGRALLSQDAPSSSTVVAWWKSPWKLHVPHKVRIFLWRVCHNWIPTMWNLASRGLQVELQCPICSKKPETTMHALWGCSGLKQLWKVCYFLKDFVWRVAR